MKKYAEILRKVRIVMEDGEAVDNIMNQHDKASETKELYIVNRKKDQLLLIGEVKPDDYLEALKYS
jgi:hypothetical protein